MAARRHPDMKHVFSALQRAFKGRLPQQAAAAPVTEVAVLADSDNASITYLIEPWLARLGLSSARMNAGRVPPADIGAAGCRTVVIARYLPTHWEPALVRFRAGGGKLIYFMDDDLMDENAMVGLPAAYAKKIRTQAMRQRVLLESLCAEFWVASPYLQAKYPAWQARLVTPRPSVASVTRMPVTTVCYHGTASHQAELDWLAAVIGDLQQREPSTSFEVFGDHHINRLFRGLPRVAVLHPMSWPNYLAYTASVTRDIALAPLLPNPFNAARGPTKFFDFARMGAVGIYSDVVPYRGFVRDGVDGILLPNDRALWIDTIARLANDPDRRRRMAQAAREKALALAWDAGTPSLPDTDTQIKFTTA